MKTLLKQGLTIFRKFDFLNKICILGYLNFFIAKTEPSVYYYLSLEQLYKNCTDSSYQFIQSVIGKY